MGEEKYIHRVNYEVGTKIEFEVCYEIINNSVDNLSTCDTIFFDVKDKRNFRDNQTVKPILFFNKGNLHINLPSNPQCCEKNGTERKRIEYKLFAVICWNDADILFIDDKGEPV